MKAQDIRENLKALEQKRAEGDLLIVAFVEDPFNDISIITCTYDVLAAAEAAAAAAATAEEELALLQEDGSNSSDKESTDLMQQSQEDTGQELVRRKSSGNYYYPWQHSNQVLIQCPRQYNFLVFYAHHTQYCLNMSKSKFMLQALTTNYHPQTPRKANLTVLYVRHPKAHQKVPSFHMVSV
jgi:hypothetical protein